MTIFNLQNLKSFYEAVKAPVFVVNAGSGNIEYVNSSFAGLFGFSDKECSGKTPLFLFSRRPEYYKYIKTTQEALSGDNLSLTLDSLFTAKNGRQFPARINISFIIDNNSPLYIVGVVDDTSELHKQRQEISDLECRFEAVYDNSPVMMGMGSMDAAICLDANEALLKNTGFSKSEIAGKNAVEAGLMGAKENNELKAAIKSSGGRLCGFESFIYKKSGELMNVVFFSEVIKFCEAECLFFILMDVSRREKIEEALRGSISEKEVLLREIHHRIKNNLQMISSILYLACANIKSKTALSIFKSSQDRIKSIAFIHQKLYQTKDLSKICFSDYVADFTKELKCAYPQNCKNTEINVDMPDIFLDVDTAVPCGLIINEFVTNSIKYACCKGKKCVIHISMQNAKNKYMLTLSDNGPGLPKDVNFNSKKSLGLRLMSNLVKQINGQLAYEYNNGASFLIVFHINPKNKTI